MHPSLSRILDDPEELDEFTRGSSRHLEALYKAEVDPQMPSELWMPIRHRELLQGAYGESPVRIPTRRSPGTRIAILIALAPEPLP